MSSLTVVAAEASSASWTLLIAPASALIGAVLGYLSSALAARRQRTHAARALRFSVVKDAYAQWLRVAQDTGMDVESFARTGKSPDREPRTLGAEAMATIRLVGSEEVVSAAKQLALVLGPFIDAANELVASRGNEPEEQKSAEFKALQRSMDEAQSHVETVMRAHLDSLLEMA